MDSSKTLDGRFHLDGSAGMGITGDREATAHELSTLSHRIEPNPDDLCPRIETAAIVADCAAQVVSGKLE